MTVRDASGSSRDYWATPRRQFVSIDGQRIVAPGMGNEPCRMQTDAEYAEYCEGRAALQAASRQADALWSEELARHRASQPLTD